MKPIQQNIDLASFIRDPYPALAHPAAGRAHRICPRTGRDFDEQTGRYFHL